MQWYQVEIPINENQRNCASSKIMHKYCFHFLWPILVSCRNRRKGPLVMTKCELMIMTSVTCVFWSVFMKEHTLVNQHHTDSEDTWNLIFCSALWSVSRTKRQKILPSPASVLLPLPPESWNQLRQYLCAVAPTVPTRETGNGHGSWASRDVCIEAILGEQLMQPRELSCLHSPAACFMFAWEILCFMKSRVLISVKHRMLYLEILQLL